MSAQRPRILNLDLAVLDGRGNGNGNGNGGQTSGVNSLKSLVQSVRFEAERSAICHRS